MALGVFKEESRRGAAPDGSGQGKVFFPDRHLQPRGEALTVIRQPVVGTRDPRPVLSSPGKIIACIPAHNEEVAIGSVVLKTKEHVDRVVVIDDCSSDGTGKVASLAGAEVVTHGQRQGYGGALKTALQIANATRAKGLVVLDGDGQHYPDDIPRLLGPLTRGEADVIIGSRFLQSNKNVPIHRKLGIKVITKLVNLGMSTPVSDAQSGFRAFSRRAIETLSVSDKGMGASTQMLLDAAHGGLKIVEVPISVRYDVEGSSQNPFSHALGVLGQLVRYAEKKHPLLIFTLPGGILFATGFLQALLALVSYTRGAVVPLGVALISMVLILVGVLSVFTGLMLHAIVDVG